jgi:hypothetical protein
MKAIRYITLGLVGMLALGSCSDQFLEDKKNYDNVSKDVYNYEEGCEARLNDIYSWCLPTVSDATWQYPSMGNADICSKSTEEYSGFSDFVNPELELSSTESGTSVPDFIMGNKANIQQSVYGRIRNINDCIAGISGGTLSQEQKNKMLGQVYFFRAWCYYNLFKWYGGVPIVTDVQDPVEGTTNPRQSARKVKDFILSDLDKAAKLLAPYTMNGGWGASNWGRVTTGTALALKGRVLLLWCSPLFNRANDEERWKSAYTTMKAELDSITACGYHLYQDNGANGRAFSTMFAQSGVNPEAVFVTLYNNIVGDGLDTQKNNVWESKIRPANANMSSGGKNASAMLVDMFPMKDGKIPAGTGTYTKLETSEDAYDNTVPFQDRDPRFYRTFALPGFRWAYSGDATQFDPNNPASSTDYTLWNYVWYTDKNDQGNVESGESYAADNLLNRKSAVYVRKKSDDADANSPLYNFSNTKSGPYFSAAPLIELRYAEVLLNFAEVACGAGHMDEAVEQLKKIRERVGYTGDCGLQANLTSDQAACMSAILYERQIEFAYEGKRFDDMRMWMLFDGGTEMPAGAPATWKLTGWGGNTCTWLGFKPFNGQRRENMEFRLNDSFGVGGKTFDSDPLYTAEVKQLAADEGITEKEVKEKYTYYQVVAKARPKGVDLRKDLTSQLETLNKWYKTNLVRGLKKGDAYNSQHISEYIDFRPKYYLLGFPAGVSDAAKQLPQTIGWEDYNNGGAMGTFDPLAD